MIKPTNWLCAQRRHRSAWASTQSDQSIRCALNGYLRTHAFFMRTAKTLIRLGGCPGWSESSLGAHATLLVLSWGGSYNVSGLTVRFYEPHNDNTCFMSYANNKDADQPAHPRSLISVFVIRCLDSMIPIYLLYTKFEEACCISQGLEVMNFKRF